MPALHISMSWLRIPTISRPGFSAHLLVGILQRCNNPRSGAIAGEQYRARTKPHLHTWKERELWCRSRKEHLDTRTSGTWAICTRRAGKLHKARCRLYRSKILQVNTKYSLESSRRDLQNTLLSVLCTALESESEKRGDL